MRNLFWLIFPLFLMAPYLIYAERGTRAKTMHNQTQRSPQSSTSSSSSSHRPPSQSTSNSGYHPPPPSVTPPLPAVSSPPPASHSAPPAPTSGDPPAKNTTTVESCPECELDYVTPAGEGSVEAERDSKDFLLNSISITSRVALTNWNFHFSPAIQYQSTFLPTYELDLNFLGVEFSYLTTFPLQSSNLFREIPVIDQKSSVRNSLIESLSLGAFPLMFMKEPLLRNLISFEFRKTTKSTTIRANQNLYYFPAASYPGLTEQDSDLGTIFYDEKPAGTQLSYNIKERDWLFTLGFYALRAGYFDLSYSKPYQMDADIYQDDRLIEQRVYLFEGQATGQGFMLGLQNLFFPTWNNGRFYFSLPDRLANGFFWGLKELGFYWGSGNIRLQNNIDLVEKYKAFYQGESGHEPSVSFLRQVFHPIIGYKFSRHFKLILEYRYVNYTLTLTDKYDDENYNYFLNHAINRDTVQQFAVNLTYNF